MNTVGVILARGTQTDQTVSIGNSLDVKRKFGTQPVVCVR